MKPYFVFAITSLGLILLVYFTPWPVLQGELAQKPIYTALQAAEVESGNKSDPILYAERDGHKLVGIIDETGERLWVAGSSAKSKAALHMLPDKERIDVRCSLTRRIDHARVSESVIKILNSLCHSD